MVYCVSSKKSSKDAYRRVRTLVPPGLLIPELLEDSSSLYSAPESSTGVSHAHTRCSAGHWGISTYKRVHACTPQPRYKIILGELRTNSTPALARLRWKVQTHVFTFTPTFPTRFIRCLARDCATRFYRQSDRLVRM